MPATVTLCSCIASRSADCVLGVARLISSASTICAKSGPDWKRNSRRPSGDSVMMFVPMMSEGIRSGVNWMRLKLRSSTSRQRADEERLAEAGNAFEQHVPADEEARQHAADDVALADDDLADLGFECREPGAELGSAFGQWGVGREHEGMLLSSRR